MVKTLAAVALLLAAPAAAQTTYPAGSGLPPSMGVETGNIYTGGRDDISSRIDRRESARFRAAKAARKARERAERDRARAARAG